jgi:hypothetical protein
MYAVLRLVKRFEDLTTVDILVNYESEICLSFFFLWYLKRLFPNTLIPHHFPDCEVCNYLVIQEFRPLEHRETKKFAKNRSFSAPQHLPPTLSSIQGLLASFIHPVPTSYCVGGCWLDWNFGVTYIGVTIPCNATYIQSRVIPRVCFYHCLVFVPSLSIVLTN